MSDAVGHNLDAVVISTVNTTLPTIVLKKNVKEKRKRWK